MAVVILSVGLLVFFGHFLADFFQRTKVPDVLILMLAGIVLGPVTGWVEPSDFGAVGPVFTTLALIIILFEGGIHLNIRTLGAAASDTLAISLSTFVITVLLLAYVADLLLPIDFRTALLLGTILGGTSSAVVVPLIRVLKMATLPSTILFLESAITDILVIVLALGLLEALVATGSNLSTASLSIDIALSFVVAGLIGTAGAFVWSAILERIRRVPNTVFTTIAYVFILYGTAELLGYSGAIAALAFGIAVANFPNIPERLVGKLFAFRLSALSEHERAFFGEAVFLVKTFFFVYLGASITFDRWQDGAIALLIVATVLIARLPVIRLLAPKATSRRDGALMTALVPKGLASAVLASIPVQRGLPEGGVIAAVVYPAIFFSIVACAVLVFLVERGSLVVLTDGWLGKLPVEQPSEAEETPIALSPLDPFALETAAEVHDPHVVSLEPKPVQPAPPSSPESATPEAPPTD